MHGTTFRFWAAAVVVSIGLMGCVTSPANGDSQCPGNAFPISGFAENPGATVQVEAFNVGTSTWEVVASTTSSTSAFTFGGNSAYSWSTTVTLAARYFTHFTPDAFGSIRVREVGGDLSNLITFDHDGVSCVVDKVVNQNMTWFAAGWACRSAAEPVISLTCVG